MTQLRFRRLALAASAATAFASPAFAQDDAQEPAGGDGGLDITATVTGVSDYRFRGVSASDRDPALQGSLDVTWHGSYSQKVASTNLKFQDYFLATRGSCQRPGRIPPLPRDEWTRLCDGLTHAARHLPR